MTHVFPLRSRLACAVTSALLVLSTPVLAQPASASTTHSLQISAGPLDAALEQLARKAGLTLTYQAADVRGLRTVGLAGSYSAEAGLQLLLSGSGLTAVRLAPNDFALRPVPKTGDASQGSEQQMAEISVTAANEAKLETEGSGSYAAALASTATRFALSPRETPQSLTVITRQQMDDQGISTLADVLQQTPGVSVSHDDSERYNYYARGFNLNSFQYDGVPTFDFSTNSNGLGIRDMAVYDRVEVVRGASGLMSGAGSPAGAVNLVRKKPTSTFQAYAQASVGSWSRYRAEADISGPLNDSGSVRGRLVTAYQDHGSYIDFYKQNKSVAYGVIEADVAPGTRLTAGVDYQKIDSAGSSFGQNPLFYSDGSRTQFPRSFNPAARWTDAGSTSTRVFAGAEHLFQNGWQIKAEASHWKGDTDQLQANIISWGPYPDLDTGLASVQRGAKTYVINNNSLDLYATGPFSWLGRQHELVLGMNVSDRNSDYIAYSGGNVEVDYRHWNNQVPRPAVMKVSLTQEYAFKEYAAYAAARFKPADGLSLILGSRFNSYERTGNLIYGSGDTGRDDAREKNKLVPYAGAVYDINQTYSAYISYANIFEPQSVSDANYQALPPTTGKSWETGIKGEFFDRKLNASVALFHIKQDNLADYVGTDDNERDIYRAIDGTTTRGIELEVSGQLQPGWQVQAGATYSRPRDKDGQRIDTTRPERSFKLATSYRLHGDWQRLTVGANVNWQGRTYYHTVLNDDAPAYADEGSFSVAGLMARYAFSNKVSAVLNINNLFNKTYYSGYGLYGSGYYGDPRNVQLTVRASF
ncbi:MULTISPECIES: TonB-dependent siderophore receptor [unclassified Janthinobacterium]|uniref:TonB-dependent siderophore receptor n=1 Tax=unclassified Janthinobacterium TaxID=2610881 RepID=UPI00161A6DBA|nr:MULTISPECIES: TonB-dependent siderophore receptor [unclassified Janthinobacterium]MBB5606537.1 outer membrane receptor for ferric coprogen and ferric-rhodotorulic acid [Janthinobacterium sp. S3T4]MBB5611591.1 outer membrane receptor for ferric coprogen and ferric-rhodotorulic acid [Janthinobacterium sp. S3M3]